jgi:ubiquinone/menaquinone biosynthesis C-methylase UbiE
MSSGSRYERFCNQAYGLARSWLTPGLQNSQWAYRARLIEALQARGRWLDLGCGHDFLPPWFSADDRSLNLAGWTVAGVDLDDTSLKRHPGLTWRIHADIQQLPFRARTFDLITANMVLEHVRNPELLFREVARVLTDRGCFLIHTPNLHGYTTAFTRLLPQRLLAPLAGLLLGRRPEDVYETYYRANSQSRLQQLAAASHLTIDAFRFVDSSPQLIRVPPMMLCELLWIRSLGPAGRARHRACLLATFRKGPEPELF